MEKALLTPMTVDDSGKHTLWMCDQSDHAVFVRSDLKAEHVLKAAVTIKN